MRKLYKARRFILIFMVFLASAASGEACGSCIVFYNNPPSCIAEKLDIYYRLHYSDMWSYLNSSEKLIKTENNASGVANFFEIIPFVRGNAEIEEFFMNLILEILIERSDFLSEIFLNSSSEVQEHIVIQVRNSYSYDPDMIKDWLDSNAAEF